MCGQSMVHLYAASGRGRTGPLRDHHCPRPTVLLVFVLLRPLAKDPAATLSQCRWCDKATVHWHAAM